MSILVCVAERKDRSEGLCVWLFCFYHAACASSVLLCVFPSCSHTYIFIDLRYVGVDVQGGKVPAVSEGAAVRERDWLGEAVPQVA